MKVRSRGSAGVVTPGGYVPLKDQSQTRVEETKTVQRGDGVSISSKGRDISSAREIALAAPPVRAGLVEQLSEKIEKGEYQVEGADVAPKMIREHLMMLELGR